MTTRSIRFATATATATATAIALLAIAAVVPLASCGPASKVAALVSDPAVGDLAAKVKTLVDGLKLLPSTVTGAVSSDKLTTIKGWIGDLGKLATDVSTTTSLATATPLVTQIGKVVDDVVAALPAGTLSGETVSLVSAATSYLPEIEKLVGLFGARHPGAARSFGGMSPADAERVLVAAAATAAIRR